MHCKNFSLIDTGNGEYALSPAYDLLAVLLADPEDNEEMAMSFTVGGAKNGFNRSTFLSAFTQSGIKVQGIGELAQICAAGVASGQNGQPQPEVQVVPVPHEQDSGIDLRKRQA